MYRVLLVDDEPLTLMGLRKTFNWDEMGYQIISETVNSLEALDIIYRKKPDVVFSDIRMPEVSGLELMKRARERDIDTEFVIISGFSEFSYAQEAIRYGAFEYCLKPIKIDSENALLKRLSQRLEKKRAQSMFISVEEESDINGVNNENFYKMLEYIHEHYNERLYLKELASQFYINLNYCCELFRKVKNCTFTEYITELRMKKAEELLRESFLSVDEVSRNIGFNDYFYFIRVFSKYFGITPSRYIKNFRKTGVLVR